MRVNMNKEIRKVEKKLLEEIREYTFNNKELLNAHHFMFACPVEKNGEAADVIICGLNPGGNPKEDFRVLCANCHRMVHRKNPPYTINELKAKFS